MRDVADLLDRLATECRDVHHFPMLSALNISHRYLPDTDEGEGWEVVADVTVVPRGWATSGSEADPR